MSDKNSLVDLGDEERTELVGLTRAAQPSGPGATWFRSPLPAQELTGCGIQPHPGGHVSSHEVLHRSEKDGLPLQPASLCVERWEWSSRRRRWQPPRSSIADVAKTHAAGTGLSSLSGEPAHHQQVRLRSPSQPGDPPPLCRARRRPHNGHILVKRTEPMPLNDDARTYLDMAAARSRPVHNATPAQAREQQRARSTWANGTPEPIARVYDRDVPGPDAPIPVRVYVPVLTDAHMPVLAFFHGGGWVTGDLDTHDVLCRALAIRSRSIVVAVDYPLAPEHRFPAGLDACWAVTRWLGEHAAELGGDPSRLAIGGDSAGGNLAAVVALRARQHGGPHLALQILLYPSTDYRLDQPADTLLSTAYGLTVDGLRFYYTHYLRTPADALDPEVSPIRARDLSGLAPAYVVTTEFDPLREQGEAYAARLLASGVPVTSCQYPGQIHGFIRATGVIREAWEAIEDIAAALRIAFSRNVAPLAAARQR
jgi:acetyl esterase